MKRAFVQLAAPQRATLLEVGIPDAVEYAKVKSLQSRLQRTHERERSMIQGCENARLRFSRSRMSHAG